MSNNKQCVDIFIQLLNGHDELAHKIINHKKELELEDSREEYINRDFSNWLSNDIFLRNYLEITKINYLDLEIEDSQEFITDNIDNAYYNGVSINDYYIYYEIFENELGLTNHMRTRSLTDSYKSQWWKTTQKNNLPWNNIHRYINNPLTIKIYYKKFRYGWSYEEFFTELFDMPHNFRDPTIRERQEILKSYFYIMDKKYQYIILQDLSRGYLLVDVKLSII